MKKIQFGKPSIIGAAIAVAAAPVVLVAAAAPAHAQTKIDTATNPFGVTVFVESVGPAKSSGWCTYSATPNGPGVPASAVPFYLQEGKPSQMWFPGIKTGITWDVVVSCPNGSNGISQKVVY